MQLAEDLVIKLVVFYVLIALGFLIKRFSARAVLINRHVTSALLYLFLPILILDTFMSSSVVSVAELPVIIALVLMMHVMGPGFLLLLFRRKFLEGRKKGALLLTVTFSNAVFLAFPLVLLFIGDEGIQIATVYAIIQMLVIATLGTAIGSVYGGGDVSRKKIIQRGILFPPFLASLVALLLISVGVTVPIELDPALTLSNTLTTYLSLLVVGLSLNSHIPRPDVRNAFEAVIVKQVIVPLVFIMLFVVFSLSSVVEQVLLIEVLMPPAVLTVVYSGGFGLDQDCAATAVTVGTLALLPLVPILPLLLA